MALSNKKSIAKAMNNLIKSGATEPKKLFVPKIKVVDIWHKHKTLFTPSLQKAMNNKVFNLCHEYNEITNEETAKLKPSHDPYPDEPNAPVSLSSIMASNIMATEKEKKNLYRTVCRLGMEYEYEYTRKIALVKFFGCSMDKNRRDATAVKALAKVLEPLAKQGYIKGSLQKLGKIRLMDHDDSNISSKKVIMCYIAVTDLGEAYLTANPTELEFKEGGMPFELP